MCKYSCLKNVQILNTECLTSVRKYAIYARTDHSSVVSLAASWSWSLQN